MANKFGREMAQRRNELQSQVEEGLLEQSEAEQSLAGWLLKKWEDGESHGVNTYPTLAEAALENAKAALLP